MGRRRSRTQRRIFSPPPLPASEEPLPSHLASASAGAIWQAGEQAEEEFDYEGARALYREAVRKSGDDVAEFAERYAAFLVERYGQFEEVAAWLDDPAFDPTAAAGDAQVPVLATHVATAAAETGHPRAADLDQELATAFGVPSSLTRVASRWVEAGQWTDALTLLQRHEKRIDPRSSAGELLRKLVQRGEDAVSADLAPAAEALAAGELALAGRLLAEQSARHSGSGRFRSLAAHLEQQQASARAAEHRQAIASLVAQDALEQALAAARRWAQDDEAGEQKAAEIEALIEAKERLLAVRPLHSIAAKSPETWGLLAELQARFDAALQVPSEHDEAWQLVCTLADAGVTAELPTQASVADALITATAQEDWPTATAAAGRLHDVARAADPVARALKALTRQQRAVAREAEAARLLEAETALADGDWRSAEIAAQAHRGDDAVLAGRWRELLRGVEDAKLDEQGAKRLQQAAQEAIDAGHWLEAERLLGALELAGGDEEWLQARSVVVEEGRRSLVAAPMPPFGLSVTEAPIAVGVLGERMAIVQGSLWLNVNLQTRGLSPFRLPEAYAVDAKPTPRIAADGGTLRLVGLSKGRLVVIEQEDGGRPTVVAAAPLAELLKGEQLSHWATDPNADEWALLTRSSGKKAGRLVRIDAATLTVNGGERHKPALNGICPIRHANGWLATTALEQRMRRGFAMAWLGGGGAPRATWTQEELGEPIAALRKAVAWPEQDRVFASYSAFDPFQPGETVAQPSLLVLKGLRPVFASGDLRRRFAPIERLTIDHAWTLDPANGRLWFAALPRQDHESDDAMLLGVNARNLRADRPRSVPGAQRILALVALSDGAGALCRLHEGGLAVARAHSDGHDLQIRVDKLPLG